MVKRSTASEYTPRGEWILVRRAAAPPAPTKTATAPKLLAADAREGGGFDVVEAAAVGRKNQGLVEAVGPGDYQNGVRIPVGSKVGEVVAFAEQAAIEAEKFFPELRGEGLFFVPDSMVICGKAEAAAERRAISA